MADSEKDEVPMLSGSHSQALDEHVDSQLRRSVSCSRSASLSIDMTSMESHERETNLVGHTGPLRSQRTPFVPMSGPLYANHRTDNLLRPSQAITGQKEAEAKIENYPSINGINQNDWPDDNFARRNDHLLRSGQLGMCNDPYCTTCPSYYSYKVNPRKQYKAYSHVRFFLIPVQF
ncbi:hypothetical protein TorRG33x02_334780 [Trema orientale]|uniref:Uncharacterized protein n=1 Tax=Trema orientale TaxID=63057 RepID=A0A2P5B298_TREOI|nr:hypothetical protein TorRG33x02_334780 [Trema orientale]